MIEFTYKLYMIFFIHEYLLIKKLSRFLGELSNLKSGKVWEISQRGVGVTNLKVEFPNFNLGQRGVRRLESMSQKEGLPS